MTPHQRPRPVTPLRWRFEGEIAAFGTAAGYRIVVGRWPVSPFGPISDVMLEAPGGRRLLMAPSEQVGSFIASTYHFDVVEVTTIDMTRQPGQLAVVAGPLRAELTIGRRGWLGLLLRTVPRPLATALSGPLWWIRSPGPCSLGCGPAVAPDQDAASGMGPGIFILWWR